VIQNEKIKQGKPLILLNITTVLQVIKKEEMGWFRQRLPIISGS